ncbi:MAG TPA: hypothetical protein PLN64_00955 [Candidatus Bipolaricaulis anaerobius]|nr:hypothetical protein [Candidatus Bipolaricaulis anaerobius]
MAANAERCKFVPEGERCHYDPETTHCNYDPPKNGGDLFVKRLGSILAVIAFVVGGYIGVTGQIEAAVAREAYSRERAISELAGQHSASLTVEETARKEGDVRIEKALESIRAELADLNRYLRERSR